MTDATETLTIDAFIEARLREDEETARAAGGERWAYDGDDTLSPSSGEVYYPDAPRREISGNFHTVTRGNEEGTMPGVQPENGRHIARHDPARVLRQCAALRAIMRVNVDVADSDSGASIQIAEAIASIWSSHPDFRAEWSA